MDTAPAVVAGHLIPGFCCGFEKYFQCQGGRLDAAPAKLGSNEDGCDENCAAFRFASVLPKVALSREFGFSHLPSTETVSAKPYPNDSEGSRSAARLQAAPAFVPENPSSRA